MQRQIKKADDKTNECYNCWMGNPPDESRRILKEAIADRNEWLLVLQVIIADELESKALRTSDDAQYLYNAYYNLQQRRAQDHRESNCSGHNFKYSFSTSHEHIDECAECGATQGR